MALPRGLPVVDHHCHLSPDGEGVRAAARFRAAGGTHLFLATQNYDRRPLTDLEDYRRQFDTTETLARQVHESTGVVVYPVLAPYPLDLLEAAPAIGLPAALELHRAALDLAGARVRERRAVALGEVGRPHFPIAADLEAASREAFRHALQAAREADCPVVIHSEDLGPAGYRGFAEEAGRAGVPARRVVKHYARQRIDPDDAAGVARSYLARRELVRAVIDDPAPWFLETDFLDDPGRPGAVLDLATVPRRARAIADDSVRGADRLWGPFSESIERVYGWRPAVEDGPAA
ncbi:MAG TPA: TatD family hydrolase [Thermoplasmata archaeon]|nr:TatD family hydrolase [Thermoplasmata archaeon]